MTGLGHHGPPGDQRRAPVPAATGALPSEADAGFQASSSSRKYYFLFVNGKPTRQFTNVNNHGLSAINNYIV